jgi:hypothetical protein
VVFDSGVLPLAFESGPAAVESGRLRIERCVAGAAIAKFLNIFLALKPIQAIFLRQPPVCSSSFQVEKGFC